MWERNISLEHIRKAQVRIAPYAHTTPVLQCRTLDHLSGHQLYFKAECFQKTGSFKARGALNAILKLKEETLDGIPGIVTHSSGNHGQAVAYAAQWCQLPCTVIVPTTTSSVKVDAIRNYGAEVMYCEPSPKSRKETCEKVANSTGKILIHPYDNYDVIAGQGTVGAELLDQVPDLDAILTPISGGGLTSGIAVATKGIKPQCKVFPVEPHGKELGPCLRAKQRLWSNPPRFVQTIGDGITTQQLGELTFPIVCELCECDVFTVKDEEMITAMRLLWERVKIIVEPSSSAALAACLSTQMKTMDPKLQKIGVVLSGGNVDLDKLPWVQRS